MLVWPIFLFKISEFTPEIPNEEFLLYVTLECQPVNKKNILFVISGMILEIGNEKGDPTGNTGTH